MAENRGACKLMRQAERRWYAGMVGADGFEPPTYSV